MLFGLTTTKLNKLYYYLNKLYYHSDFVWMPLQAYLYSATEAAVVYFSCVCTNNTLFVVLFCVILYATNNFQVLLSLPSHQFLATPCMVKTHS